MLRNCAPEVCRSDLRIATSSHVICQLCTVILEKWYKLKLTEIETGITIGTFSGHTDWFDSVVYAPGAQDKPVKMWNVSTGTNIATLRGNNHWVDALAFSPDGTKLASASVEGTILLWDLKAVD